MQLPPGLARLFRNYVFTSLDDQRHAAMVIKTVLSLGEWEDILWLFRHYGHEKVGEVFLADYYGLQELPEPTRRLWALLFGPDEPAARSDDAASRWGCRRFPPRQNR